MMRLVTGRTGSAVTLPDEMWSETLKTDPSFPDGIPTVFNIHSLILTTFSQSVLSLSTGLTGPTGVMSCWNAVRMEDTGSGFASGGR